MLLNEYTLYLSTGEELLVSELDPALSEVDPVVLAAAHMALTLCTHASRDEIEQAKGGYDGPLKSKLRAGPVGCLLKFREPVCSQINMCVMASRPKCTTRKTTKHGGNFPHCWTSSSADSGLSTTDVRVAEIVDSVVHAWREGRHVIVIDG